MVLLNQQPRPDAYPADLASEGVQEEADSSMEGSQQDSLLGRVTATAESGGALSTATPSHSAQWDGRLHHRLHDSPLAGQWPPLKRGGFEMLSAGPERSRGSQPRESDTGSCFPHVTCTVQEQLCLPEGQMCNRALVVTVASGPPPPGNPLP